MPKKYTGATPNNQGSRDICTILGCGGSKGVPKIGCKCEVCTSSDPKNNRTRSSILVEIGAEGGEKGENTIILVDAGPDLRIQALREDVTRIDAVIITHNHYDHSCGLNDCRELIKSDSGTIPCFLDKVSGEGIRQGSPYLFKTTADYPAPFTFSTFENECKSFKFRDIQIEPIWQKHGRTFSYSFRFGNLAYSTDFSEINKNMIETLRGLDVWIVDCVRYGYTPTHSYLEQTLEAIDILSPSLAILTHMADDIDYNVIKQMLPKNVIPAFDGMKIGFDHTKII